VHRLLIGCVLASGCGETAVLELTLDLPPEGQEREFVYVQARSGTRPFEEVWSDESSFSGIALTTTSQRTPISLVAEPEQLDSLVRLKLRFCRAALCDHPLDSSGLSEQWVEIERAFYDGERTELTIAVLAVPAPCETTGCVEAGLRRIDKCDVRGCTDDPDGPFCSGDRHLCE
jgi:hypothetical protein